MENVKDKINWRQFGKHWIVVFILAILAGFVIWGMLSGGSWFREWQAKRFAITIQNRLKDIYSKDKYGGKTPEETYSLFISALEKGDINLASKYFVLERQSSWVKILQDYKNRSLLSNFISELNNNTKIRGEVQFKRYPSGNWKINNL